jgi:exosome complex component RRP41
MPNLDAVTLLQMDGQLTPKEFEGATKMAIDGCKQIYDIQKEALKTKYKVVEQEEDEE